jgi:hypothetical protein
MDVFGAIGLGLLAGTVGTVALTLAEKIEMQISGRELSTVPGQVGAKVIGRDAQADPQVAERLNPVVHWVHGISMGAVRGLLGFAGLGFLPATGVFFLVVWGGDVLLYRALGIAKMPWSWSGPELAADLWGKGVYVVATSAAFVALDAGL